MHGCDAAAGKEILKNKAPGKIIKLRKDVRIIIADN